MIEPMNVEEFDEKYKEVGGMAALTEMRALWCSGNHIAKKFGVSKERIYQWMRHYFKSGYDPRPTRRELIINAMVEFASKNPRSEFDSAYSKKNKEYYQKALKECIERKIYVE